MQFFVIHPDPVTNANMLPEYAITKVNCREGIQVLSDIGHNLGVTWEGQNKAYSIWHAETRRFMVNRESFELFVQHLLQCLLKYKEIKGKHCAYHDKFLIAKVSEIACALPQSRSHEDFMLDYLVRGKASKMSEYDLKRLKEYQTDREEKK